MTTYLPSMNKKDDIYFLIRRNNRKLLHSEKIFSCNKNLSKFHYSCWNEFDAEIQATSFIPNSFLITSKEIIYVRGCTIKKRKKNNESYK